MKCLGFYFVLNNFEKIIIKLDEEDMNDVGCCSESVISLLINGTRYKVFHDLASFSFRVFCFFLQQALDNKLEPHDSIASDIGYLWNEKLQKKPGLVFEEKENIKRWVGLKNLMWSTRSNVVPPLDTWMYNIDGAIVLEVTPTYPWSRYKDNYARTKYKNYIPYEEWIKTYQPILTRTIPREVAQQWLDQANAILKKIDENMKRFEAEESSEV